MSDCFLYDICSHIDCESDVCIRKYKLEHLYKASLLSEQQRRHISLKIDDDGTDLMEFRQLADISNNIETFILSGKNLYLHSTTMGCGKSSWAIRMIESYFNHIWPKTDLTCRALFVSVPRFLLALKENISGNNNYATYIQEHILSADLVVWDDIAAKVGTEFELNHLLSLIETRTSAGKSNIYTSNLNPEEMRVALGDRITSRICNLSIDIELHGKDKRGLSSVAQNMEAVDNA